MTLNDLHAALIKLPGHETLALEDFRLSQDVLDPGNPGELQFYLTGPDTFYLHLTQIDTGHETTLAEYSADVLAEAEMRR